MLLSRSLVKILKNKVSKYIFISNQMVYHCNLITEYNSYSNTVKMLFLLYSINL